MTTLEKINDLMERSKLNLTDISKLCGISRSAMYQWMTNNKQPKSPIVKAHIERTLAGIDKATRKGLFPTRHIEREFRFQSIVNIMRHVEGLDTPSR